MSTSNSGPKRPYATLDLKATEIRVTPINDKQAPAAATVKADDVPLPLPAKAYATPAALADVKAATSTATASKATATSSSVAQASASTSAGSQGSGVKAEASAEASPKMKGAARVTSQDQGSAPAAVVGKRGGVFSHLAAGLIGGAVALAATIVGLPLLEKQGIIAPLGLSTGGSTLVADQVAKLEAAHASALQATDARFAALEKSAQLIGDVRDAQSRLVAETKAALAASASEAGLPDQAERIAGLEAKLKAMADAGANSPNASRVEQIAALTGKVADLETNMTAQLTALRKSVAGDVEARVLAATEAAETAKTGMERINRDVAALKTEAAKVDERVALFKAEVDRTVEQNKLRQQEFAGLKVELDSVKSATAKPADVASAVAPVSNKIMELEKNLKAVAEAEQARQNNAERVVLALELQNLKRALDRGQTYESELAEVEKAAAGKFDLAALAKFKQQGVPTLPDLTRDFRTSANTIIDAEAGIEPTSVVDRLLAGAKSVVRVRRTDYAPNDTSAEAVAARMEKALKEGRLADVIAEAAALSPKAKDAAQPFIEKVSARATVDKALASLEGQLKSSLSGTAAQPTSRTE